MKYWQKIFLSTVIICLIVLDISILIVVSYSYSFSKKTERDSALREQSRVCPKICVNTIIGANRAILIQGGSRGIRLPSCLQHNAGGAGCQGRRSRLITLDIRARRCYSGMRSAK